MARSSHDRHKIHNPVSFKQKLNCNVFLFREKKSLIVGIQFHIWNRNSRFSDAPVESSTSEWDNLFLDFFSALILCVWFFFCFQQFYASNDISTIITTTGEYMKLINFHSVTNYSFFDCLEGNETTKRKEKKQNHIVCLYVKALNTCCRLEVRV